MNILVYINTATHLSKSAFEVVTYASKIGGNISVIATGTASDDVLASLGEYGAKNVLIDRTVATDDAHQLTQLIGNAVVATQADLVLFSHDIIAKAVAPRLSVKLKAGLVSGAIAIPDTSNGFVVKVNVFSGKAIGHVAVNSAIKIVSLLPNSIQPEKTGSACAVSAFDGNVSASKITVLETKKPEGAIPLPEAELVVSAGRGLKGPENWNMVEDLANALGAATACSRPVADIGWRPHHEHVGQTGVAIRPNLYIAAGISGAIQHLAGVNGSKVIVVINTDAEAPFFKAADYGVVGDAFDVLPKLTEAVKKFKATQH
jgi:electron transfer flavoprotein alpha subunit